MILGISSATIRNLIDNEPSTDTCKAGTVAATAEVGFLTRLCLTCANEITPHSKCSAIRIAAFLHDDLVDQYSTTNTLTSTKESVAVERSQARTIFTTIHSDLVGHTYCSALYGTIMATTTMTHIQSHSAKSKDKQIPENIRFMQACSDIANALVQDYESQYNSTKPKKDVNLNSLRGQMAKKHRLSTQPPLTAIIAAVPEQYKKYILPKLIAKPVRTASGIAVVAVMCKPHRCPHIAYT